jgi:hypothetical protein
MIVQELLPAQIISPAHIPFLDVDGKPYYLLVSSATATRDPPTYEGPRGGILCEEMGAGKTLQTLSLILATLSHLPTPPLFLPAQTTYLKPEQGVPSLRNMARHLLRSDPILAVHPEQINRHRAADRVSLERMWKHKPMCWYKVAAIQQGSGIADGRGKRSGEVVRVPRRVWLGWGTLAVVPDSQSLSTLPPAGRMS